MPADVAMTAQAAEPEQFQTGRVLTITAGHAVHDTYAGFLPPLLPAFIESLSLSKAEAGLLTVFYQAHRFFSRSSAIWPTASASASWSSLPRPARRAHRPA